MKQQQKRYQIAKIIEENMGVVKQGRNPRSMTDAQSFNERWEKNSVLSMFHSKPL